VKPPFSILLILHAVSAKFTMKVEQTFIDFALEPVEQPVDVVALELGAGAVAGAVAQFV
jgi:fumarate reductase subunit C